MGPTFSLIFVITEFNSLENIHDQLEFVVMFYHVYYHWQS